ncbi:MAG: HIT domain-containing protein [Chloroflexi bacterium]|nr:HIT domain-containing protein [Chloroflexota bacterium]
MKHLWTPWRMPYLKAPKETTMTGCIFCDKFRANGEQDRDNLVLWRGQRAGIVMNLYPYTNGHLMVAPYAHTGELETLDAVTLQEMMLLVAQSIRALRAYANPHGFNVGANLGKCAGAGVEDHVHLHIVPRWNGDTNFMPVLAETRMIPEMLPDTYDKIFSVLQADAEKAG